MKFFGNEGGHRKLSLYLRRDYDLVVNHKKMHRICKAHGLGLAKRRGQKQQHRRISSNRQITGPDQLWQFDIKYGYIPGENRYFYVCGFIDVFTRRVIDFHIGLRCTAEDILATLRRALKKRKIDDSHHLIIRSDNGPQMSSRKFESELAALPCEHEFIPTATPNKNAFIESFFSVAWLNISISTTPNGFMVRSRCRPKILKRFGRHHRSYKRTKLPHEKCPTRRGLTGRQLFFGSR